jgi:hypothetical protein
MGLLDFITGGDKKNDGKGTPQGGSQTAKPTQNGYQSALPTMQGNIPFVGTGTQSSPAQGSAPVFPPQQFQVAPQPMNVPPQPVSEVMDNSAQPIDPIPGYQPTPTSDPNSMQVEQEMGDGSQPASSADMGSVNLTNDEQINNLTPSNLTEPVDPMLNPVSSSTSDVLMAEENLAVTEPSLDINNTTVPETSLQAPTTVDLGTQPPVQEEDPLVSSVDDLVMPNDQQNGEAGSQPASDSLSLTDQPLNEVTPEAGEPQPMIEQAASDSPVIDQSTIVPENTAAEIEPTQTVAEDKTEEPKADLSGFNFDPSKLDFSKFNLPTDDSANTPTGEPEMLSSEPLVDTIVEPTAPADVSVPMSEAGEDQSADQVATPIVEQTPQQSNVKKVYNKAAILGLSGNSTDITAEGTKGLVVELLNNSIEISIDSENAVSAELLKVAEELGKEIQGIYLKPLVASQNDTDMNFPSLGNKSTVFSNYLDWVKEIVKSSNLFIFLNNASIQNHALLLTFISLSKMYGEKGKRVVLYGNWQEKVQSLIQAGILTQEDVSNVSIVATPGELTAKINELDSSFAGGNMLANKVADKRSEGDESDYLVS